MATRTAASGPRPHDHDHEERARALEREGLAGTPVARIGRVTAERGGLVLPREGAPHAEARELRRGGHDHFRLP